MAQLPQVNAELRQALAESLQRENATATGLREALEHQTATAEVLSIISRSPIDVQPVLDAIVESAARVCRIDDVVLRLRDGDVMVAQAHFGSIAIARIKISVDEPQYRWIGEHGALHIPDSRAQNDFPTVGSGGGWRTVLYVPFRKHGELIGYLCARRTEVLPFTPAQIKLLETFADQAVIAIDNVRLFQELKESLEQQTATSEILGVIASSPTDIQPVLDTVVENAVRLAGAEKGHIYQYDGEFLRSVAYFNETAEEIAVMRDQPIRPEPGSLNSRAFLEGQHFQRLDAQADVNYRGPGRPAGARSSLAVPLLREGTAIGTITIWRDVVEAFSERQIELVKTFAAQAVIAIENVRLFKELGERNAELREALEHQTATAEVLGIISRSPTDVQPVLEAIVESAARVCGIDDVHLRLRGGNKSVLRAHFGPVPIGSVEIGIDAPSVRWVRDHGTLHIPDVRAQNEIELLSPGPLRTFLSVPLRQQGELIGALTARRMEVRSFTPAQIKLLETFADQAVIAIENVRLFQELKESLEQQTATSEILGVIASSPTDIQPVLDTIATNAARLCESYDAVIQRVHGDFLLRVAHFGPVPVGKGRPPLAISRDFPSGRAIVDRQTVHVDDILSEIETEFPDAGAIQQRSGSRTVLATPLLSKGVPIGVLMIRRTEVRPFTDKQIALLKTFADQAVIAIENVRLFKELQERNAELREALEHQTATAEVLGIISRSPTDVQPVLDAIVESAAKVCGIDDLGLRLRDGNDFVSRARFGPIAVGFSHEKIGVDEPRFRWVVEHGTLHIPDAQAQNDFPMLGVLSGARTFLLVPLRQQGEVVGTLTARRTEVRPFTPAQIKLLETFADQAVIAIENVRLFQELTEALEQQTATGNILQVIASSPTDIQPVLNAVAESAVRLCAAEDATIRLVDGNLLRLGAHYGTISITGAEQDRPMNRQSVMGRAAVDRQVIHFEDLQLVNDTEFPGNRVPSRDIHTMLATPLLREGVAIGVIGLRRTQVRPFAEKQIALLKTFADQAVIAIENVRLFKELEARNRDLSEALEQQTATSEILRVIASSPTDIQPVLDVVAENAARLCDATDAVIHRVDGDKLRTVANYGPLPGLRGQGLRQIDRDTIPGRTVIDRRTLHIEDLAALPEDDLRAPFARTVGVRTVLATPMLREGISIGTIHIRRMEVRPFTDKQIKLLETFADQAVIAIENVRLFQELEQRTGELARSVGELKALGEVGQAVSSTLELETVLATIVAHAVQLSGTDCGVIYEYDEVGQEFHLRASHRMEKEVVDALRAAPIRLGEGVTGQAVTTRGPVQVPDILDQREYTGTRLRPMLTRLGYRSLLSIPLFRDQQIMGGLTVWRRQSGNLKPEIINLLQTFATQSALAIQNARLFRETEDKSRQIEAANRHKSEFLANMSHELRTPLNAIIGFSEVLGERLFGDLNEKQAEYTDDILSSGRHLLSLINEILDLSKVEAGRMELELAKFDLPLAIDNARTFVRERATTHGITVDVKVDERLGEFLGDERKIKQILLNLLSNAVKFTPEGGRIGINAVQSNGAVEISVTDTGIGIAPEDQAKVFEEFRQVGSDHAHKVEGTGLGLTLAKKFVELHGGKIWVTSDPGRGSSFTFSLPVIAAT
jgi:GAF domain-containing protein